MKIFLSHARKDSALARRLAQRLTRVGFEAWISDDEIAPGDNWAKKIGKALDTSDLMVFLLTPRAMESDWLREDIQFAIGSQKYEGRVFTVFVGPSAPTAKDVPWILLKLPHCQVQSDRGFGNVVRKIQVLAAHSEESLSNA